MELTGISSLLPGLVEGNGFSLQQTFSFSASFSKKLRKAMDMSANATSRKVGFGFIQVGFVFTKLAVFSTRQFNKKLK